MQPRTNPESPARTAPRPSDDATPVVTPPIDVLETDDALTVLIDVPGVDADSLELSVAREKLELTAHRRAPLFEPAYRYRRTFQIPREVDADGIDAKLEDGVLTLRFPKRVTPTSRSIRVRTS